MSSRALNRADPATERGPDRGPQRGLRIGPRRHLGGRRREHRAEPELDRLGDPAVGVADPAQLAGQPDLAEAGERAALGNGKRLPPVRRDQRQARRSAPRRRR